MSLRDDFDLGFAAAPAAARGAHLDLLLLRIAGSAYAIQSRDVSALHVDLRIAPMPTRRSEFLGLTTLRNAMLPIYDLAALLGRGATPAGARWCVLTAREPVVGYLFEGFDGHARIPDRAWTTGGVLHGVVELGGESRAVLDAAALAARIGKES